MKKSLDVLRGGINDVNYQLLALLNLRSMLVKDIIELKDTAGMDYFDPVREEEMFENILKRNNGPLPNELVKKMFSAIFRSTLDYMGMNRGKSLLISSQSSECFQSIHTMFNLLPGTPVIIAGPCAVENIRYLEDIAVLLNRVGVKFLRGGAYKPRTSPYDFQGLKEEGIKILSEIGKKYNLITVTEVVDTRDVDMLVKFVDVLQIGARNMQNFELLKEVGQTKRPILLKRGLNATIQEFLYAAEYIALQGNRKIILCERGIRTFETKTRNTLDIASVPIIKKEANLPIIVDISHSLGRKDIANPVGKAALAVGADGIMVEVHPYPEIALSDSKQQLSPDEFIEFINYIFA